MNNKSNHFVATNCNNSISNSNWVEYNLLVQHKLLLTPMSYLQHVAVKNFKDLAKRNKYSKKTYNKEVMLFNNRHGLLLEKLPEETTATSIATTSTTTYNYINYPYLDREAVKTTMNNYRKQVFIYNKKVAKENREISQYNADVIPSTSKKYRQEIAAFKASNSWRFTRDYNSRVEAYNSTFKHACLPKKRIQTIKFATEILFHTILGFYVKQLKIRNATLMRSNQTTRTLKNQLPKLKIDHRKLATHKIADIPRLNIVKKTAQNHIKRLREAGLLINYSMTNQNKPISVNFNTSILVVLDGNFPKSQKPKNQNVMSGNKKKLPHNNEPTRAFLLKESKIKDNANCIDPIISGSMPQSTSYNSFPKIYKNTTGIDKKKKTGAGENLQEVLPQFLKNSKGSAPNKIIPNHLDQKQSKYSAASNNLRELIQDERELAQQLANHQFDTYKGLRYERLKAEVYAGILDKHEFRQLLIQDFVKTAAKIWKKHHVFVGDWKKAINQLNEKLFKTNFIGSNNQPHKEKCLQILESYRWMQNFARKWFLKNEVNALYPSLYFDPTRTKSQEIGFFGLRSVYKSHITYLEKRGVETKQQAIASTKRKRTISQQQKLTRAIAKFEKGKIDYNQLYNYVQDNLHIDYLLQLPQLIVKHTNNNA